MRKPGFLAVLSIALLIFPVCSYGIQIQLKLSSGLRFIHLDEVNLGLSGWENGIRHQGDLFPGYSFETGKAGTLRSGFDFEAELLFSFSRWLGLGLSGGYVYASLDEEETRLSLRQDSALYVYARPTKVSANTFLISGYLSLPMGQKFSIHARAGLGVILARYASREAFRSAADSRFSYLRYDKAKARDSIYLGGFGLSYAFEPNLGFFLEAFFEPAKVGGLSGENLGGEKGTLYSFEEYRPDLDFWQAKMQVLAEQPAGANVRDVREAAIDFSGYSIKIGVILRF
ncbi:MAG: hypothetical protein AB1715_00615 [Acidobacteriota bacterium]